MSIQTIIIRGGQYGGKQVTEQEMRADLRAFTTGYDRHERTEISESGEQYDIIWIAHKATGRLLVMWEISHASEPGDRWYSLRTLGLIRKELLASEEPWQSERLTALVSNLADEISDQRKAMEA